jgi:hypothetical protein
LCQSGPVNNQRGYLEISPPNGEEDEFKEKEKKTENSQTIQLKDA